MAFVTQWDHRPLVGVGEGRAHGNVMELAQARPPAMRTEPVVEIAPDLGKLSSLKP